MERDCWFLISQLLYSEPKSILTNQCWSKFACNRSITIVFQFAWDTFIFALIHACMELLICMSFTNKILLLLVSRVPLSSALNSPVVICLFFDFLRFFLDFFDHCCWSASSTLLASVFNLHPFHVQFNTIQPQFSSHYIDVLIPLLFDASLLYTISTPLICILNPFLNCFVQFTSMNLNSIHAQRLTFEYQPICVLVYVFFFVFFSFERLSCVISN